MVLLLFPISFEVKIPILAGVMSIIIAYNFESIFSFSIIRKSVIRKLKNYIKYEKSIFHIININHYFS
jgi:hypothetical protein